MVDPQPTGPASPPLTATSDTMPPDEDPLTPDPDYCIPTSVVIRRYNLEERKVQEMCVDGRLDAILIGNHWRIHRDYHQDILKASAETVADKRTRLAKRRRDDALSRKAQRAAAKVSGR